MLSAAADFLSHADGAFTKRILIFEKKSTKKGKIPPKYDKCHIKNAGKPPQASLRLFLSLSGMFNKFCSLVP
jgi:hypothetical protein